MKPNEEHERREEEKYKEREGREGLHKRMHEKGVKERVKKGNEKRITLTRNQTLRINIKKEESNKGGEK